MLSVCFKVFDMDRDGVLSESEMKHMVDVLLFVREENHTVDEKSQSSSLTALLDKIGKNIYKLDLSVLHVQFVFTNIHRVYVAFTLIILYFIC